MKQILPTSIKNKEKISRLSFLLFVFVSKVKHLIKLLDQSSRKKRFQYLTDQDSRQRIERNKEKIARFFIFLFFVLLLLTSVKHLSSHTIKVQETEKDSKVICLTEEQD